MIILGLTGPIGHGKTSFAEYLTSLEPNALHFETSNVVSEIANAMHRAITDIPDPYNVGSLNNWLRCLPTILSEVVDFKCYFSDIELHQEIMQKQPLEYQKLILHVENLQRNPNLITKDITVKNKEDYRPLLQFLGGYLVQKLDAGIWWNEVMRRIANAEAAGAKLCAAGSLRYPNDAAIFRASGGVIVQIIRPGHLQSDLLDPTERERTKITADCTILNNGTLADLKKFSARFLKDLKAKKLEQVYHAASL